MTKRLVPTLVIMSGLLSQSAYLNAEESVSEDVIDINATRLPMAVEDQPYALYRLDRDEIDFRAGRTLTDSMHNTPGVAMQKTAHNQASPFIRGLTGEQTLMLLDGVRFNHAMMRPGPNQYAAMIPKESVASVDVILGSASTILGSDGLTGAIDFRLAEPGRGTEETASGFADVRVSSAEAGGSVALGLDGRSGGWAYTAEIGFESYGDLTGGRHSGDNLFGSAAGDEEIPNTEYDQQNLAARARYDALEDQIFEVSFGVIQQNDAPRPDGYFENSNKDDRISRYFEDQDFTYLHLKHFYIPESDAIEEIKTTLWYHQHDEVQIRERIQDEGTINERYRRQEKEDTIGTTGIEVQAQQTIAEVHQLTYGINYFMDRADTKYKEYRSPAGDLDPANATERVFTADEADARATIPDGSEYNGLGIYVQDLWNVNETWNVLTGLRYSRYDWNADVTERDFDTDEIDGDASAVTLNVRASWDTQEEWKGFVGISQGFRAPNLQNLVGAEGVGSGATIFAGNPDLDPEMSISYETGVRYQMDDEHKSYYALNVFITQIDDIIQRVYKDIDGDMTLDPVVTNGDDATLQGFEFYFDHALEKVPYFSDKGTFSVYSVTNYVDSEQTKRLSDNSKYEDNISRADRFFGVIGAKFEHQNRWWGAVQLRWSDAYDEVEEGDPSDPN